MSITSHNLNRQHIFTSSRWILQSSVCIKQQRDRSVLSGTVMQLGTWEARRKDAISFKLQGCVTGPSGILSAS